MRRIYMVKWPQRRLLTHYERLGIEPDAAVSDIKAAYRKKALECHPDVVEKQQRSAAEAAFCRLSEAYETLSDPEKRTAYDEVRLKKTVRKYRNETTLSKKAPYVRQTADKAFRNAFAGKSLEQVLFRLRYTKRQGLKLEHSELRNVATRGFSVVERLLKNASIAHGVAKQAPSLDIPFTLCGKCPPGIKSWEPPEPHHSFVEKKDKVSEVLLKKCDSTFDYVKYKDLMAQCEGSRTNEGKLYSYQRPY